MHTGTCSVAFMSRGYELECRAVVSFCATLYVYIKSRNAKSKYNLYHRT